MEINQKMAAAKDLFCKAYGDRVGNASIGIFKEIRKSQNKPVKLTHKSINKSQLEQSLNLDNPNVREFYRGLSVEFALEQGDQSSDDRIKILFQYSLEVCLLMGISENTFAEIIVMSLLAIIRDEHHTADALINSCATPFVVSELLINKQRARGAQGGRPVHEMTAEVSRLAEKRHKEVPYESNEALIDYVLKNLDVVLKDEKKKHIPSRSTIRRIISESTAISKTRLKAGRK